MYLLYNKYYFFYEYILPAKAGIHALHYVDSLGKRLQRS